MTLLERQSLIDQLDVLLAEAVRGHGRVVAIKGEAGVGKSALVRAFADSAAGTAQILWGACEDLATPEPLGPLQEIARGINWDLQASIRQDGRLATFSEAVEVFGRAGKVSLVVIEDLHWADDATLDFVRFLGRRIATSRILLLLTSRGDEAQARTRLRRALADIPSHSVTRIDVPLLSEAAVAILARSAGCEPAAIHRLSAGNAFYVTELIRSPDGVTLPASVTDTVLARIDRLPPAAREVLEVVSIIPRRAELALVDAVLQRQSASDIEECVAASMLTISDDTCAFRHEVARRAVLEALPLQRRRTLNARALQALGQDNAAVTRLAHHAQEANDPVAIRTYAPIAGKEAARLGAHREAVEHFRAALTFANTFNLVERLDLYERFAFECHLVGRIKDALAAQKSALELYQAAGDCLREGDSLRWLSRLSYLDGNRSDADMYGELAAELLEPLPPGAELAMAYSNLSQLAMLANQPDAAADYGARAIALAEPGALDRPDILCHALNNVGSAAQWRDPGYARQQLDRSLQIALANGFPEHAARTYTNRGWLEFQQLADADAVTWLEAGIAYCIENDLDTWRDYMRAWLAEAHLRQGRWDEAAATAHLVLANEDAAPLARYPANLALAKLRTRRNDPADDLMQALAGYLETGLELQRLAPYAVLMAEQAWLGLAPQEAAAALLDKARSMATDTTMTAEVVCWQQRLGVDAKIPNMPAAPEPYRLMLAGNWDAAARAWQHLAAPYEQALALLKGDHAAQRQALEIFDHLGATAASARVRDLLRLEGVRPSRHGPRASTRSNSWGLTSRQIDVLKLVDGGLSNGQIADKLFISPKTVDHHISAILDKLDARSRGEAAAIARSSGLISK